MSTIALPSLSGDELPAVTVPPVRNAGVSPASASSELSARTPSSRVMELPATGTISSSKTPWSHAAAALRWLRRANSSCSSREMP
jgi:hypothetical protein